MTRETVLSETPGSTVSLAETAAELAHLAAAASARGAKALIGRYIPSAKNKMVAQHYEKLGFEVTDESPDGGKTYRLALAGYPAPELPMRIDDRALAILETQS